MRRRKLLVALAVLAVVVAAGVVVWPRPLTHDREIETCKRAGTLPRDYEP